MAARRIPVYRGVAKKEGKTVTRSQPAEFVAEGGTGSVSERTGRKRESATARKRDGDRGGSVIWKGETKIIGVGKREREREGRRGGGAEGRRVKAARKENKTVGGGDERERRRQGSIHSNSVVKATACPTAL